MTEEEYEKVKRAYEESNPGKVFEHLRLYEMNMYRALRERERRKEVTYERFCVE